MKKFLFLLFSICFFALYANAEISVTPYGAAQSVSGSCFLVDADGEKALVDCGLFMDNDGESGSSKGDLNADMPKELTNAGFLVLTHAHLDHCGRVPLLVSAGFNGKIYSTRATKELALSLFMDRYGFDIIERKWFWSESQRIKSQNSNSTAVAHWNERCNENIKSVEYSSSAITLRDLSKSNNVKFLACKNCCASEVEKIDAMFEVVQYDADIDVSENIKIKLINAGHIPGSASVMLNIKGKKILFSGDLGSGYSRLNGEFKIPEKADLVFMEATYYEDKAGMSFTDYDNFQNDIEKAVKDGKIIWIPALSFNRTQKVLYELKLMQNNGKLSKEFPIYSVSPSANNITEIYQKELKSKEGGWFLDEIYKEGSLLPVNVNLKKAASFDKPMILISSSGDMDKGMSERLLPAMISKKNLFIMIVNYVSPASPAGQLLSGRNKVKGIKSNAAIKKYDIFSDHAGFNMLQKWLLKQNKKTGLYIIHSSSDNSAKAEAALKKLGWKNVSAAVLKEKAVLRK
jgi:Predicted exonuclease of the beta-lactamase fold involved in RNA processing